MLDTRPARPGWRPAALAALAAASLAVAGAAAGAGSPPEPAPVIVLEVARVKVLPPAGRCLRREKLRLVAVGNGNAGGALCVTARVEEPCGGPCSFVREERDLELRLPGGWIRASLSGYIFAFTLDFADPATTTVYVQERLAGDVTGTGGVFSGSSGTVTWEGDLARPPGGDETGSRAITVALSG